MSLPNGTTVVFTIGEVAAAGGDAYAQYTGGLKSPQDYASYYAAIASGVSAVAGYGRLGPFINGLGYGVAPAAAVTQLGLNIGSLQNAQTPRDAFIASLGILSGALATMAALAPPSPLKAGLIAASVSAAALQQLAQNYETFEDFQQDILDAFDDLNEALHDNALQDWISENQFLDPVFDLPNQLFTYYEQAGTAVRQLMDPLALDLNHDGAITTVSADDGITFDHGATGVEYGTGWLNADDAWLALDVNGNGVIDSGRELFGDNTIKLDGNRAKDAFDALASFDANSDGKVDIADATGDTDLDGVMEAGETYWDMNHSGVYDASTDKIFTDLRLWKDANSNGNTDAGELLTLASQHVVSISTGKTAANVADNENLKTGTGSYTTDLDDNNDSVADTYGTAQFNLTENAFFRVFATTPTVSSAIAALPNMQGSGAVRDLQEAA